MFGLSCGLEFQDLAGARMIGSRGSGKSSLGSGLFCGLLFSGWGGPVLCVLCWLLGFRIPSTSFNLSSHSLKQLQAQA